MVQLIKIAGDVLEEAKNEQIPEKVHCILADPPYFIDLGNHESNYKCEWDSTKGSTQSNLVGWYLEWTRAYAEKLCDGGSLYVWGGVGKQKMRVFFEYAARVEHETNLKIQAVLTWHKKRAYGTANNYLFTREEVLFMVKGDKPCTFNIPYLDKERGYEGYNKDYPAKSKFLRRSMVWNDVTEIFKGKTHAAQKPERLSEIMIQTSTNPGDWVIDLFSGSGSARKAAERLGRNCISIEKDPSLLK